MSQAGRLKVTSGTLPPDVPTTFVADVGTATPVAHILNILGTSTVAGSIPVETTASGNTLTVDIQKSQAIASTDATKIGLAAFDSSSFSVDANGFVTFHGGATGISSIGTQTGTNPISPTAGGLVTINGAVVSAGTNPVRSDGTSSHTMAIEVQISQALAAADATKIGLCNFDSAKFTVDANGFVSTSGTGIAQTITGNSGGALAPTAGNWNILGTGSITTSGAGSSLTAQLTGLTNHALQIGAGTATLTQLGAGSTGQVLQTNTSADPTWSTATYPSTATGTGTILRADGTNWVATTATYPNTTTINRVLYSSANNTISEITTAIDGVMITSHTGVPSILANSGTPGWVLTANSGAPPSWQAASGGLSSSDYTQVLLLGGM